MLMYEDKATSVLPLGHLGRMLIDGSTTWLAKDLRDSSYHDSVSSVICSIQARHYTRNVHLTLWLYWDHMLAQEQIHARILMGK
jgi:hypothetical protein